MTFFVRTAKARRDKGRLEFNFDGMTSKRTNLRSSSSVAAISASRINTVSFKDLFAFSSSSTLFRSKARVCASPWLSCSLAAISFLLASNPSVRSAIPICVHGRSCQLRSTFYGGETMHLRLEISTLSVGARGGDTVLVACFISSCAASKPARIALETANVASREVFSLGDV